MQYFKYIKKKDGSPFIDGELTTQTYGVLYDKNHELCYMTGQGEYVKIEDAENAEE